MRVSSVLIASLALLGLSAPTPAPAAESFVLTHRREPRFVPTGTGGGYARSNVRHGYIPHPNAYHKRARRAPYKGNLGRRH